MNSESIQIISEFKDSVLINIYRTVDTDYDMWFDGLGTLGFYKYIVKLNNGLLYDLGNEYITYWKQYDPLVLLKSDFLSCYQNQQIEELILVDDFVYIKLKNEKVISHDTFFGSQLRCVEYSDFISDSDT